MSVEWVRVAAESDVVEGEPFASEYGENAIALYRYEGTIFAIGDICPHEDVRLSEGWLEGDRIECPLHQSCFEIRTGKVIEGGPAYEDVAAYDVRVEDGAVFVRAAG
ncbi:non-heme iron oxygenase ferredoxin subunit [Sphingosinithalassobacter portus]|uniref:non-heme iron oxygenase ferredoxin subunit n=1 Tax=Stakelama portus TaxID=2676234 RepID=UPI0019614CC2|nr:non-heme iron oxygenase ferredoxin subunit [Sphingosinithalassobacter portus]